MSAGVTREKVKIAYHANFSLCFVACFGINSLTSVCICVVMTFLGRLVLLGVCLGR